MATNKDFVVKNGLQVGANTSIEGSITTVDSVQFDANAGITVGVGQLAWNADAGTLDLGITDDVTLQVGQETHVHVKAAEAIADGDVVYASGAVGNSGQIEVSKFIADGTIEERRVIGIATESAASGEFFYVTTFGSVGGISTDGSAVSETWVDGTILYASPTTAGALTGTLPTAPNPAIAIAFVTTAHATNGKLFIRAYDPGFHLREIHDVYISSVANNQILTYDAVNSRWSNSDDLNLPGNLDVAGNVTVTGDFTVSGNTTYVNTDNLSIEDLNIVVASGVANSSLAEGAGITIAPDSANVVLGYDATNDALDLNNTLTFSNGRDGYLTNALPGIYRAYSTTGSYPFNRYGDLVIQARSSHERDIVFVTGTTPENRMIIDAYGNIGIGNDFPSYKLDISNAPNNTLARISTNGGIAGLSFQTGTGHYRWSTQNSIHILYNEQVGHIALRVDANGDITIPTGDLTVTNDISASTIGATTVNATTLNGAFGNTAVTIGSSYGTTPSTGNMWFDNLNLKLKIYDGSNWQDAVPAGGGSSANTGSTDANSTFSKYTYVLSSATSTVSGADVANNTLSYDTSGIENVEVFVNGVKQVEGSSYDYAATTGTSIGFTTTLSAGDVVDVQVYELLTNDAYYLKTETYTQTEVNSQITTALGGYVPATGGTFTGVVQFGDSTGDHTKFGVSATNSMMSFDSTGTNKSGGMTYRADRGNLQILTANTWGGAALSINHVRDDYQLGTTIDEPQTINMRVDGIDFGNIGAYANTTVRSMQLNPGTNGHILLASASGNVGVNNYDPKQKLSVDGVINADFNADYYGAWMSGNSATNGYSYMAVGEWYSTGLYIQKKTGEGRSHIYNYNANHPIVIAAGSGSQGETAGGSNVGIGQNPDAKLHVYAGGDTNLAFFDGTASNAYVWIRNGTATTGNKAILGFAPANNVSGGGIVMEAVEDFSTTANRTSKMTFQTRKDGTVYDHITIDQSGHLYPEGTAQDLGTSTKPWQNIYTQDLVLSNEARPTGNEVDGTKGNWTIQEGEDHLYIINNKNGKKYRFALEEIE